MSVDMYEHRFRKELAKLAPFELDEGKRDGRVWPQRGSKEGEFPAWRALFTALLMEGHCRKYRLFSFETFFKLCRQTYAERHPEAAQRFVKYFRGDLLEGMRHRCGVWYESGMAETHLYTCLVEAIEDKSKNGVVLYDPRADWKLKADVMIMLNNTPIRISAFVGDIENRPRVEREREVIERDRKVNTLESSHFGNRQLNGMRTLTIRRIETDQQVVNGVRLFSPAAVNRLLTEIYDHARVDDQRDRWLYSLDKPGELTNRGSRPRI